MVWRVHPTGACCDETVINPRAHGQPVARPFDFFEPLAQITDSMCIVVWIRTKIITMLRGCLSSAANQKRNPGQRGHVRS